MEWQVVEKYSCSVCMCIATASSSRQACVDNMNSLLYMYMFVQCIISHAIVTDIATHMLYSKTSM